MDDSGWLDGNGWMVDGRMDSGCTVKRQKGGGWTDGRMVSG